MPSNLSYSQPIRLVVALAAGLLLALALAAPSADAAGRDSDGDGMPNRWERAHELNPHRANASGDPDRDRLVILTRPSTMPIQCETGSPLRHT